MIRKDKNVAQCKSELRSFHLFAGAGGGVLADLLLGHQVIGACEIEEYPREVLLQRQRDGILPEFPIWDDITTLNGTDWRGRVDLVCGGFPCQDISSAGKGEGISGSRSGLWTEMARVISEIQPRYVFVENSPMLVSRGLGVVLGDLATMGYDAEWGVLGGGETNGFCKRERIWILASPHSIRRKKFCLLNRHKIQGKICEDKSDKWYGVWGHAKRCVQYDDWSEMVLSFPFGDGAKMAHRVDRVKAVGNGQDPILAATAFTILKQRLLTNDMKGNQ